MRAEALGALRRLRENGFAAYLVGGCVRDLLSGKEPHDFDLTTAARPEEMQRLFADVPTFSTGLQHGTLTVLWQGVPLEITTFRTDGAYTDGRHPQSVTFSRRLADDLQRRDFTVNAMALLPTGLAPLRGETEPFVHTPFGLLADLYGGRADLEQKILRCVGDADTRFTEDALRILRAARFACTLGFSIEDATFCAMRRKKEGLQKISAERKWAELQKLLTGQNPGKTLTDCRDVLEDILPGLGQAKQLQVLDETSGLPAAARLGVLCYLLYGQAEDPAEQTGALLRHLRSDKHSLQQSTLQVRLLGDDALRATLTAYDNTDYPIKKLCADHGVPAAKTYLRQQCVLCRGSAEKAAFAAAVQRIENWEQNGICLSLSQLAVNGKDLLSLGIVPAQIGENLQALLTAVLRGELPNEREALLLRAGKR